MHCSITKTVPIVRTPRVLQLEGLFDVPPAERSENRWDVTLPLDERDWQIGLIVGPSGCGKSTLAREFFGERLVSGYDWPADRSIVDAFPKKMGIKEITGLLSSVGFSSPPNWLRPFACLSNGEQFRVTIARALAESQSGKVSESQSLDPATLRPFDFSTSLVVIDEFTSVVDRTVARIGSAAIAKTVRRGAGKFVAVSCHYDVLDWLQPDWTYEPATDTFHWRLLRRRPAIEITVERVHRQAWKIFAPHHYLSTDLSRSARCFVGLVEGRPAVFTAVIHATHPTRPSWREHRTVCLPDYQGVGIGNAFSEFIASLFVGTGKIYTSTTSAPSMVRHRATSPLWDMRRPPSMVETNSHTGLRQGTAQPLKNSCGRITTGFIYVGPPAPPEIAAGLLESDPAVYVPSDAGEKIVAILKQRPHSSPARLARLAGLSTTTARHVLDRLAATGQALRHGTGRRPDVYTYTSRGQVEHVGGDGEKSLRSPAEDRLGEGLRVGQNPAIGALAKRVAGRLGDREAINQVDAPDHRPVD